MPVHVAEKHELSAVLQHPNRARKKGSKFRNSCFNRSRGKKFSKCCKSINKKVKNAVLTWQPQTVVSFGPEFWSIEPVSSRIDEREWFWFFYKPVCSHLVSISYLRYLLFRFCSSRIIEREIGPSSKQWETHLVSVHFMTSALQVLLIQEIYERDRFRFFFKAVSFSTCMKLSIVTLFLCSFSRWNPLQSLRPFCEFASSLKKVKNYDL